jgi:hypothetical protein
MQPTFLAESGVIPLGQMEHAMAGQGSSFAMTVPSHYVFSELDSNLTGLQDEIVSPRIEVEPTFAFSELLDSSQSREEWRMMSPNNLITPDSYLLEITSPRVSETGDITPPVNCDRNAKGVRPQTFVAVMPKPGNSAQMMDECGVGNISQPTMRKRYLFFERH